MLYRMNIVKVLILLATAHLFLTGCGNPPDIQPIPKIKKTQSGLKDIVPPLLKVSWDQGFPYNKKMPQLNGKRTYTGCVTIALGQLMKYYNYPARGTGQKSYYWDRGQREISLDFSKLSYNWKNIPNSLSKANTSQQNDVAGLLYNIAASLNLQFGLDAGSSAGGMFIERALINHFGYDRKMYMAARAAYTSKEWHKLIQDELRAGRPVLHLATDKKVGHAFIIDGFKGNGLYHVNWGWGGKSNGYYSLDKLQPTGSRYTFNDNALILVGMQPKGWTGGQTGGSSNPPKTTSKGDLVLEEVALSQKQKLQAGQVIVASVTVKNSGTLNTKSGKIKYYLSKDKYYNEGDIYLNYDRFYSLQKGATSEEEANLRIPANQSRGAYYILIVADPNGEIDELREDNNVVAIQVTVGDVEISEPGSAKGKDLIIEKVSTSVSSASPNQQFAVNCIVRNKGKETVHFSRLKYYLSEDKQFDSNDKYLNYDHVQALGTNHQSFENANLRIPRGKAAGKYYILFVIDPGNDVVESNEKNNVVAIPFEIK